MRVRSLCGVKDCDLLVKGRGFCDKHYSRLMRHGSPTARLKGEIVDGRRICRACGVDKVIAEWGVNRHNKTGLSAHCRACMALRQKAVRAQPQHVPTPRNRGKDKARARLWRSLNPDAARSHSAIRRARRKRVPAAPFSVKTVFERDAWACHICTHGIDQAIAYPDPMSPSIDHVVPLAKGGPHSLENVAAAHLICNMRKKDRIGVRP